MKKTLWIVLSLLVLAATGASRASADQLWAFSGTAGCGEIFGGSFVTDNNGLLTSSSIVGTGGCLSQDGHFNNINFGTRTANTFDLADNPFAGGDDNLHLDFVNPLTPAPVGTVDNLDLSDSYYIDCCSDFVFLDRGSATAVPEPGTLLMLGTGLLGVAGGLKRKYLS